MTSGKKRRSYHKDPGNVTIGPAIKSALYSFLKNCSLTKTAKYFKKETSSQPIVGIDFSLEPLFDRIEEEFKSEQTTRLSKKRKHGGNSSDEQARQVTKKVKKHSSKKEATSTPSEEKSDANLSAHIRKGPLKRIDADYWRSQARIQDNSYWAKGGDDFASKAAEELGRVSGKNFRYEKQKKKKAGWKGAGTIDMGVNSTLLDSS